MERLQMASISSTSQTALDIGDAQHKKALSYAAKTGTAIDLVVVSIADAKAEFTLGPVKLYNAIRKNLSEEEIDALPLPGSRWQLPDGTLNNNADICSWKDPSKPGDSKPKEISFYVVWSDGTPEGAHVVQELEWISRISTAGMKIDDIPKDWQDKYAANPITLRQRKKYLEGRRGTVRKAYKDAVRLLWQIDMVNELAGCACHVDDDSNEPTVTLVNKATIKNGVASNWEVFSVGAFLKLKPAKALEAGGSYEALKATAERGKKDDKNKNKQGLQLNAIATPDTSGKVAAMELSYLDKLWADRKGGEYGAFLRHLLSDGGKADVLTYGDLRNILNDMFKMDMVQNIYDVEKQKANEAAKITGTK